MLSDKDRQFILNVVSAYGTAIGTITSPGIRASAEAVLDAEVRAIAARGVSGGHEESQVKERT